MTNQPSRATAIGRIALFAIAGCYIYAMNSGIRDNYGILVNPVVENSGISFASMGLVLAVGQLAFGLVQPLFGILAAKRGYTLALLLGAALMMAGLVLTPFCTSTLALVLCMGVILPAGAGGTSFGVIMGAVTPKIPSKLVSTVSGMVSASNGIGIAIFAPIISALIQSRGLMHALLALCAPVALIIPLAFLVGKKKGESNQALPGMNESGVKALFGTVFKDKTYIYLLAGFSTCGFHMALIANHLPTEYLSYGFSAEAVAYVFSIYGITTIIGSLASGILCGKFRMKSVLGFIYGLRPIIILFFLLTPKTLFSITAFAVLLGLTGAATVPPVSGLTGARFGAKNLATLFGVVFVGHQIGGFFGAWFGGICYNATGSYAAIWIVDAALCVLAAIASFAIRDEQHIGKSGFKIEE